MLTILIGIPLGGMYSRKYGQKKAQKGYFDNCHSKLFLVLSLEKNYILNFPL